MKIEHWLTIATIIVLIINAVAVTLAPVLAVLAQYRINQPKPKPVANQPKNLIQMIGDLLKRRLKMFVFLGFITLVDIAILAFELSKSTPLTRKSVMTIAFSTGLILFYVTGTQLIGLAHISGNVAEEEEAEIQQLKTELEKQRSQIESMMDIMQLQHEILSLPDKPPETMRNKLRTMLKNLLGE